MEEEKLEAEGRFYIRCGELLGVPYTYTPYPFKRRTRWNNRTAGNGRYEGCGIIRIFGTMVHMSLYHPVKTNRWFKNCEEAIAFLEAI